jgi:hypothetical protein
MSRNKRMRTPYAGHRPAQRVRRVDGAINVRMAELFDGMARFAGGHCGCQGLVAEVALSSAHRTAQVLVHDVAQFAEARHLRRCFV